MEQKHDYWLTTKFNNLYRKYVQSMQSAAGKLSCDITALKHSTNTEYYYYYYYYYYYCAYYAYY